MGPTPTRTNGGLDRPRPGRFPVSMRRHRPLRRAAVPVLALLLALAVVPLDGILGHPPVARAATEIRPRVPGIKPLTKEVYGYLPYWRLDSGTVDRLHYELVSTIAFFGLGIKSTGALDTAWVGYKEYVGDDAAAVTNAAHDKGVRVVPTFQLFDSGSGYPKMTAFLNSVAAQDRFIGQALALMAERKADGAGLDFEPVGALAARAPQFVAFVARFRAAMKRQFPDAELVNATSAGATQALVAGIAPYVDRQMIMTYNYRWSGSTVTGAIAPLDHATRNVKLHIEKMLQWVPAGSILLGVPYYGYDWPVTSAVPNATVQSSKKTYGAVKSVTYAGARDWLAAHPGTTRHYDSLEGSSYYTYWSSTYKTYRQVYFEDERSLAAKYDYAIVTGLAGIGIWTLDNDKGYDDLWNVLRAKFYAPVHQIAVLGTVAVTRSNGIVYATIKGRARDDGTVPERGRWSWSIRDAKGHLLRSGTFRRRLVYPGRSATETLKVRLGTTAGLRSGIYTYRVRFMVGPKIWRSAAIRFHQRY
jgi:spore germination protein YaaH